MVKRNRQPGLIDKAEDVTNSGTDDGAAPAKKAKPTHIAVNHQYGKNHEVEAVLGKNTAAPKPAQPKKTAREIIKLTRNKVIAGVDYGTTFSGLAHVWGVGTDARDVEVINDWPMGDRPKERLDKVPSKYAYASENEGLQEDKWGYEVEPWMKNYTWTKLLLDEEAAITEHDNPQYQSKVGNGWMKTPQDKTAKEVVADYMRCLLKHLMAKINKGNGKLVMKATPIHFWFTVPATWSDEAVNLTIEAARTAGFASRPGDELSVITEPEAAAMAILSGDIDKGRGLYKVGTNVLIGDLGGGTLDFQSLKITGTDPLKTEEACRGEGGKSGTFYIDCNFHDWCEDTFGEPFRKLSASKKAMGSDLINGFELVRKSFNLKNINKTFRIRCPALSNALRDAGSSPASFDFEDGEILLPGADVEKMFEPVADRAIRLATNQLQYLREEEESPYRVIALCGGLGQSEYIWQKFEQFCEDFLGGQVELVTDDQAWSAIVRGAATRGLEGSMVLSKRSKRSYGIGCHQAFGEGIDKEEDAFDCPIGGKRADHYVEFSLLKKNARITPNMETRLETYMPVYQDGEPDDLIFYWDIYSCPIDVPVLARVGDKGVERVKKIKLDLRGQYPTKKKRADTSDGTARVKPEKAQVNIVMKMGIERGVLEIEARHKRTTIGSVKIEYGQDNQRPGARSAGIA